MNLLSTINSSIRSIGSNIIAGISSVANGSLNRTVDLATNVADRFFPTCAICLGRNYRNTALTECGHTFHLICLNKWEGTQRARGINPTCPFDRRPLHPNPVNPEEVVNQPEQLLPNRPLHPNAANLEEHVNQPEYEQLELITTMLVRVRDELGNEVWEVPSA